MALFEPQPGGTVSGSLPTLVVPTAAELGIYGASSLIDWWTAEHGVDFTGGTPGWIGRKNLNRMTPLVGSDLPTVTPNSWNGQTALVSGTSTATLGELACANIIPATASYSIVWVGRRGTSTDGIIWGSEGASLSEVTSCVHRSSDDRIQITVNGTGLHTTAAAYPQSTAPHIGILSYNHGTTTAVIRINRSQVFTSSSAAANIRTRFQVMARTNTIATTSYGTRVNELMVFSEAVHLNTTLLTNIETYLNARYAL